MRTQTPGTVSPDIGATVVVVALSDGATPSRGVASRRLTWMHGPD